MPVIFASRSWRSRRRSARRCQEQQRLRPDRLTRMRTASRCIRCCTSVGIIFFCFFYVSIVFNPNEVADNMRKYGGFIPGIRPGKRTADYINDILTRITLVGALYLILISLIPES